MQREVKTLRAPNKPREAFVAFKAKNYLKIIHELKNAGEKKELSESKAEYLEALGSFVNNNPTTGWHKEVRPRLTSAVQDFFFYAPDGAKIRSKKEAQEYFDRVATDGRFIEGITVDSFSFAKVDPSELHKYPRLHISLGMGRGGSAAANATAEGSYELEAMSELMRRWRDLSQSVRRGYQERAEEDVRRYERESTVYNRWREVVRIAEAGGGRALRNKSICGVRRHPVSGRLHLCFDQAQLPVGGKEQEVYLRARRGTGTMLGYQHRKLWENMIKRWDNGFQADDDGMDDDFGVLDGEEEGAGWGGVGTSGVRRRPGYVLQYDPLVAEEEDDVLMGTMKDCTDAELGSIVKLLIDGVSGEDGVEADLTSLDGGGLARLMCVVQGLELAVGGNYNAFKVGVIKREAEVKEKRRREAEKFVKGEGAEVASASDEEERRAREKREDEARARRDEDEEVVKSGLVESVKKLGADVRNMCKSGDERVLEESGFRLVEPRGKEVGEGAKGIYRDMEEFRDGVDALEDDEDEDDDDAMVEK